MRDLDLHMTQLAGWLVNTVGKAILYATVVPAILAILGVAVGSSLLIVIAVALPPLIFGGMLWTADAPLPVEVDTPKASTSD